MQGREPIGTKQERNPRARSHARGPRHKGFQDEGAAAYWGDDLINTHSPPTGYTGGPDPRGTYMDSLCRGDKGEDFPRLDPLISVPK